MKRLKIIAATSLLLTSLSLADPPGKGKGRGGMGGPLPEEQREIIHEMARSHEQFTRKVTITGKNAKAIKVARNHATIVSGFIKKGEDALRQEHPAANKQ